MADEFGQWVKGLSEANDTIVSTDGLLPVAVKKGTTWVPFEVDSSTGYWPVDVKNSSIAVTGTVAVSGVTGDVAVVNGTTPFDANITNTSIAVTGTFWQTTQPVSFTRLDYTTDDVALYGSTGNQLVVNTDGSINVAFSSTASVNTYHRNSATLVKGTPNTVVTRSPGANEYFKAFSVTGTGLCHWELQLGTTGSEVTIMDVWTTPSHPFEYVDIPDSLLVSSTQTIRVRGTNSENAASPASDFTGYATLIRTT
jgi:hypothetical protein